MRLTNKIQKNLMRYIKGSSEIILPNFYYGLTECDVFKITASELVIEYEIKISRSDFIADFKKQNGKKHHALQNDGSHCPNRFFYVMPEGLITKDECPKYAGLLFFNQYESFDMVKNAPLLHKRKFDRYRSICKTLAFRDAELRSKISRVQNGDIEKDIARYKRESELWRSKSIEYSNELFLLKVKDKKMNKEQNPERSVATDDAHSGVADNQNPLPTEGKGE